MTLTLDQLITQVTEDEALERFLLILEDLGLQPRRWRRAGSLRTILRVLARSYSDFSKIQVEIARAGFLELARGPWLTLLARYVYGEERIAATFASGQVHVGNTGGGVYSFGPGELRVLWSSKGKAYENTETVTLNPGDEGDFDFRAVESGSASSAPPDVIDALETPITGIAVDNPEALVGTDEEKDEDLRERCKDKLASLSPDGPRGAYAYAVRKATLDDGSPVGINRRAISPDSSRGRVAVCIATPSGSPTAEEIEAVEASIERIARPDSVTVTVFGATEKTYAPTLTIWARPTTGLAAADLSSLVQSALVDLLASWPIGGIRKPPSSQGYLYTDKVKAAVMAAHASIFDVDVPDDSDFELDFDDETEVGEVAVLGSTTINVNIVPVVE